MQETCLRVGRARFSPFARTATCLFIVFSACVEPPSAQPDPPRAFRAVTFNVGTTPSLPHDEPPEDGYSSAQAAVSDTYYGDSLAWPPAVRAAAAWIAETAPDVIGLQEILSATACADVPPSERAGFVCEDWATGHTPVVRQVLGDDYQIACHPGKRDQCLGVKRSFATFRKCTTPYCDMHLIGIPVNDCGRGARVARAELDLVDGGALTVVHLHATSGQDAGDESCRVQQLEQIFVDLGDGEPGASGAFNLVLGDFNIDPFRPLANQRSGARLLDFVAPSAEAPGLREFRFVSAVGSDSPRGYRNQFDIDHVIADFASGSCWIAGVGGHPPVLPEATYFDHRPVVCELEPS